MNIRCKGKSIKFNKTEVKTFLVFCGYYREYFSIDNLNYN